MKSDLMNKRDLMYKLSKCMGVVVVMNNIYVQELLELG